MKKLFILSLVAAMFVGVGNANAMSEADLKNKINSVAVNGIVIEEGTKKQFSDYLDKYELTGKECDIIAKNIDKAIEIFKSENVTSINQLSSTAKNRLKALVSDVTSNTSVKATITDGALVVLNSDGTVFAEVDNKIVKKTGNETVLPVIAGVSFVITLVGAYFVVRQVKAN